MGNDDSRRFNFTMAAISALPIPKRIDHAIDHDSSGRA
jgi:hypothetical protein